jgi:integrase
MSVTVRPYRRGSGWEVDLTFRLPNGVRHRERSKAPVSSKSAAQRWGEDREKHLVQHGLPQIKKEVPTLEEFAPRFMDGHARANRQKPGGIAHKEGILRVHLLPRLGSRSLDGISNEDVQRLKRALVDRSPKTVNNVLTVLNTLLKRAIEWEVIDRMPCVIKLLKASEGAIDFYSFDEFGSLVRAANQLDVRAQLIVLFGGEAGLRAGEMRALRWTDVNFDKRQLCVERGEWRGHITTTKGGRLRYVPLTKRLAEALRAARHLRGPLVLYRLDGNPLTENDLRDLVLRAAKRAGLRGTGPHMLRHTFCSHLAMKGAPARAIQELAGHRDLATTQRYMHVSPTAVETAIRLLDSPGVLPGLGEMLETGKAEIANVNA